MKDLFKDPDLWRQKRGELPVDSEPQNGWQEMQSILDKHLPVLPVTAAPPISKLAKIIKAVKAMKATSILIASLTVATVTGTAIYLIKNEQDKNTSHYQPKKHNRIIGKDSLNTTSASDSLINLNTGADDSLQALKAGGKELLPFNKTDSINGTAKVNPTSSSNIKTGAPASKNSLSVINQQTRNSNNASSSLIITSKRGIRSRINPGYHRNNGRSVSFGNQTTQHPSVASDNTTAVNNLPGDLTQNGNSTNNGALGLSANTISIGQSLGMNNNAFMQPQIFANQPLSKFVIGNPYYNKQSATAQSKNSNSKNKITKSKSAAGGKTKGAKSSSGRSLSAVFANVDWGVLLGANSSGSFTPSAQNSNFYGSFPVDIYAGLFGTYHLNNNWAIDAQVRLLTPLNFSGSYTNENSGVDSAKLVKVTDSRKAYFVSIPVHAVYKITNNISVKGGPVINIPVKQINGITNVRRLTDNIDTIFLANTVNQLKTTRYDQKINLGLSGGISFQFNRLSLEALYQKSLGGYNITSGFGNYKNSPGTVQISVGLKLNGLKHH